MFGHSSAMMLDCNHYLDTMDYDLEIEYIPEFQEEAQAMLLVVQSHLFQTGIIKERYGLLIRQNAVQSKSARFFKRKAELDQHVHSHTKISKNYIYIQIKVYSVETAANERMIKWKKFMRSWNDTRNS